MLRIPLSSIIRKSIAHDLMQLGFESDREMSKKNKMPIYRRKKEKYDESIFFQVNNIIDTTETRYRRILYQLRITLTLYETDTLKFIMQAYPFLGFGPPSDIKSFYSGWLFESLEELQGYMKIFIEEFKIRGVQIFNLLTPELTKEEIDKLIIPLLNWDRIKFN